MKQNKFFILAAALAFVACSSDDNYTAKEKASQAPQEVSFGAYVNRGTTRAGRPTAFTTARMQAIGFGVFGYYTDNKYYSQTATPNFMYNQIVSGAEWTYTPVKYWPNEFGDDAESEGQDRLTFFAYAPYVEVTPENGIVTGDKTSGIVSLTSNTFIGDPYVNYYVDFEPANSVDLCWGVAAAEYTSSVVNGLNKIAIGAPYIDVMKPKIPKGSTGFENRIKFDFKHALASLNVQIDADIDVESHENSSLDNLSRIWVRSVTFEGFAEKGSLNLNSSATDGPLWFDFSSYTSKITGGKVTIYDGLRDGREPIATAASEKPNDLNPQIIQSGAYTYTPASGGNPASLTVSGITGVTNTPVNLFNSTTPAAPIYVIPTNEPVRVTIVYDVETADPNVAGYLSDGKTHGSTVENKITKDITWTAPSGGTTLVNKAMQAGYKYTIALHLGMTSVQFEAGVAAWEDGDTGKVDLPINAPGT